jgi:hypothetical protein
MITLEIIQRIWQILNPPTPGEVQLDAQELDTIDTPEGHPMLTIDTQQRRHLLIPIHPKSHPMEDAQSAGIHLIANQWGDEGQQRCYVDVVCLKPHLNDVFDLVIFDILETLPNNAIHPDQVCHQVLSQWRELLSREVGALPDTSTLLGLMGELWVLRETAQYSPQAVSAWIGPSGARYDFFTGQTALEVKSSSQRKGRRITIHGHDQMEPPDGGGVLYLAVLKWEETPGGGESLSDLVQALTSIGCDRHKLLLQMANLNITLDVISRCSSRRFRVLEQRIYRVDRGFPCITSASFKGDAFPNRITSVNYQIDLSSEPPYPLQEDEAAALYQRIAREISG